MHPPRLTWYRLSTPWHSVIDIVQHYVFRPATRDHVNTVIYVIDCRAQTCKCFSMDLHYKNLMNCGSHNSYMATTSASALD